MKKIIILAMVLLLSLATIPTFADDEHIIENDFSLWHGFRFGMTKDEIIENSSDLAFVFNRKEEAKTHARLEWNEKLDGYWLWLVKGGEMSIYLNEIAKIPFVRVLFTFDETDKMDGLLFFFGDSVNISGREPEQDYIQVIESTYKTLAKQLEQKYGAPNSSSLTSLPIEGIVTQFIGKWADYLKSQYSDPDTINPSVTMEDYISWYIEIGNGNYVKIECAIQLENEDNKNYAFQLPTYYDVIWGYSYISEEEVKNASTVFDDL